MVNAKGVLLVLVVFTLVAFSSADISVHCLYTQIVGVWKFFTTPVLIPNQNDLEHRVMLWCNRTDSQFLQTRNYVSEVTIKLEVPNKALLLHPESGEVTETGTWTMIYDQGFEVVIDQKKYFAFSVFNVSQDGTIVTSYCAETQEGWYHDTNGDSNYGCFKGQKVTVNKGDTLTTRVVNFEMRRQMHKKFENEKELVRRLNEKQRSWVATSYSEYETLTVEEMKGRAGHMAAKQWSQERRRVNRLLTDNSELSDESMLLSVPRSWDWRNVSGVNYVPPVRHQGACGSCYVFATTAMLESRIRIQYKNKYKITLSPQEVVSCSLYSQLCHGGFPYLAAKYAQDFHVVTEECFPYKGKVVSCDKKCSNSSIRVRVENYSYVGGFYGASTEHKMMKEIYRNGPIAVSFIVYPDFSYYNQGVYHHIAGIAGKHLEHGGINPWEPVNHSVTIVGWGVDDKSGEKYWIVLNSWGKKWGDQGYFKIRRGVDECSIESEAVAAKPQILFL